jgi:hypothetical protein
MHAHEQTGITGMASNVTRRKSPLSGICERWRRPTNATQITRSGAPTTATLATRIADHIGGYSRAGTISACYGL